MNDLGQRRIIYALTSILTVAIGLLWRSHLFPLSPFLRKYGGDALWALLVYLLIRFVAPRMEIVRSAAVAFGIAVAVEISQLYHAPWVEAIRAVRIGALILGSTFNWPDIPAYGIGILAGASVEQRRRRGRKSHS